MCNGCQFLNVSYNANSFDTGDETFNTFCMRYGINGPSDITKAEIKSGIEIFPECPSDSKLVDSQFDEIVAGCTDEFYD